MNTVTVEAFLIWWGVHSLQAGMLVALVIGVQWTFRRQLSARWRFALWWIVLARLLLPVNPESELSLLNLFQPAGRMATLQPAATAPVQLQVQHKSESHAFDPAASVPKTTLDSLPVIANAPAWNTGPARDETTVGSIPAVTPQDPTLGWKFKGLLMPALMAGWLAGVGLLITLGMAQAISFQRRLRRTAEPAAPELQKILDDCRKECGVTRPVAVIETEAVQTPALFGLFRLRLLLPRQMAAQFTRRELRYIFLHELAHVKRRDLWLNWLVTGLQILHWFNPVLWLGFARLRADRELACDEFVLIHTGETAGTAYGELVIKLLENLNQPAASPGLVGILADKKQMRRRIAMIAGFRQTGRWSVLALLLLTTLAAAALTDAQTRTPHSDLAGTIRPAKPNLTGSVRARNGDVLAATVFIATAGPKVGTSPFCPSCYPDCQKSARTDAAGHFEIQALDPELRFRVLVVAKGCQPKYVNRVDPAKGPISVVLDPINLAGAPPANRLHGVVKDAKGNPVSGAVVTTRGIRTRDGGGSWGSLPGTDPLAVTDENGDFLITSRKPFDLMDVMVSARGFANQIVAELTSGGAVHEIVLTEGAAISGRILYQGQPVAHVSVGMVSVNRDMEHFAGNYDAQTDAAGRFNFLNLPPDQDYQIYGDMSSFEKLGAIRLTTIHAGKDDAVTDIGDLTVEPAFRLAGRVALADGSPLPPKTRLLVSRQRAWDSLQVPLPRDGHFDVSGVPAETISLSLRLAGYRLSAKNASLDWLNPFQLMGKVTGDVTNLVLLLEKGRDLAPDYSSAPFDSDRPENRPLRGSEGGADHAYQYVVTGLVVDGQSEQPLAHLTVTPGNQNLTWNQNNWDRLNEVQGTNGAFTVYLDRRWAQPVLKIESAGYLPGLVTLRPDVRRGIKATLERGSGPAGTVVGPDGRPVAGAEVLLICDDSQQPGRDAEGHIYRWQNQGLLTETDTNGAFALKPRLEMKNLIVCTTNGFKQIDPARIASGSRIALEPLGLIKGVLHRPGGPGANEDLDLDLISADRPMHQRFHLNSHAVTDRSGSFEFDRVPAGKLLISCRLQVPGEAGWMELPLQTVELQPGQTLTLEIKAAAKASPKSYTISRTPEPVPLPGQTFHGSVRLPDGKPAHDAQVAVKVKGKYLSLGRAAFSSGPAWEDGSIMRTLPDGSFTLPRYQAAQTILALSLDGYAEVPAAEFTNASSIVLQPWGRIQGRLMSGHHPETNVIVILSGHPGPIRKISALAPGGASALIFTNTTPEPLEPVMYDSGSFRALTDNQGRFVITFVPPGEQTLSRLVPMADGAQMQERLGGIEVPPGGTVTFTHGADERTVTGKVIVAEAKTMTDFSPAHAALYGGLSRELLERFKSATIPERLALLQSDDFQNAMNPRSYPLRLAADGTFEAEGIPAGKYDLHVDFYGITAGFFSGPSKSFMSSQRIVVPPAPNTNDDAIVRLGVINLKSVSLMDFAPGK